MTFLLRPGPKVIGAIDGVSALVPTFSCLQDFFIIDVTIGIVGLFGARQNCTRRLRHHIARCLENERIAWRKHRTGSAAGIEGVLRTKRYRSASIAVLFTHTIMKPFG